MRVAGKVILITGAAGGIGSVTADLLAKNGARVYILDLMEKEGRALAEKLRAEGGDARFLRLDVTQEESWASALETVKAEAGRVDVLVNNAGINIRKPIEDMALSEWRRMMDVNLASVFLGAKFAIPLMRAQGGGCIINMSSVCGLIGHRYTTEAYTASKGGVTLLTKAIASRYAKDGIRCNSIHPSTVHTPFMDELFKDPKRKEERLGEVPLGRLATALDVANAVLYLSSDEAGFINGIALPVDGGVTAC